MTSVLKILLSLSFSGTSLILVFFLFKPLWKNKFSKQWQYYIWLIVIARLIFPFTFKINFMGMIFSHLETNVVQSEQFMLTNNILVEKEKLPINEDNTISEEKLPTISLPLLQNLSLSMCIFLIWLVIALILFVRKITIYQDFARYIKAGQKPIEDIDILNRFGILLTETKIKRNIELTTNPLISSPLFMGFFCPCIVLPNITLVDTYFYYTIKHELTHYKRCDVFYKWLVQFVTCIHWFNPFVYLMEREINRACELSCDEVVIHYMDSKEKAEYGDTLINAMEGGGHYKDSLASVTLNENKSLLKERLDSIMKYKKKSKLCIVVSIIITFTLSLGSVVTGAYTTEEILNNINLKDNTDNIESIIIKNEIWYLISNETQLRAIGTGKYGLDKKYLQNADIQMSSTEWTPIGTEDNPFTGVYDGNGFEIRGLTMKDPNAKVIGLFGFADNAILHNITMSNYDLLSAGSNISQKGIAPILVYGNNTTKSYDNTVYTDKESDTTLNLTKQNQINNAENLDTSTQKANKELFNLKDKFSYSGKFTSNAEFNLDSDTDINISIDMTADKGNLHFYIKSLEDGNNHYIHTGNANIKNTSIFLKTGKYNAIIEGDNLQGVNYEIKGNLIQINSNKTIIKETHSINIDTISPDNLVCIGQINLDKNIIYQCDITAESGDDFFIGLNPNQINSIKNVIFDQSYGMNNHKINAYFSADKPRTYYVYIVNSGNSDIKNIKGSLYLKK